MSSIFTRRLGKTDIEVSALGLGCWAIGGPFRRGDAQVGWGKIDDDQSIKAIHKALNLGASLFDTADVYGAGHSERILGRALAIHRNKVILATKFGNTFDETTREITGTNGSKEYIRSACESSLKRLQTDYIDLYQFHLGDYDLAKTEEVLEVLESLVEEGKIRYYGWSTDDTERARFFAKGKNCVSVQHQMNVLDDSPNMVRLCQELGLASINRGPLAMGLLSGKYDKNSLLPEDDVRGAKSPNWMKYFLEGKPNPEWLDKLGRIKNILSSEGRTSVQGALAWIWARSGQCIPIPGFKTEDQVEENLRAMAFGPLTKDQMNEIDELLNL